MTDTTIKIKLNQYKSGKYNTVTILISGMFIAPEVQGISFQEALCLQACEDLRDIYSRHVLKDLFDRLDIVGPGRSIHDEIISECQDILLDECRPL
jgi:hypothetical protein